MPSLPLPESLALYFRGNAFGQEGNRSLLHARGMDQYDRERDWKLGEDKKKFMEGIRAFDGGQREFAKLMQRRRAALASPEVKAVCHRVTSTSRLVCGMGLPHPAETSLLLDRLTGAPYLPGSSVKGMLRGAARLAAKGEFPKDMVSGIDAEFWKSNLDRIFGPEVDRDSTPAKGEMVFYDALPESWSKLEMDVLTPHYGPYYGPEQAVPGDWHNPVPVHFLAVKSRTTFLFWYRGLASDDTMRKSDEAAVARLLPVALDWLGIGGKKSSGYGWFSADPEDFSNANSPMASPAALQHAPARTPARQSMEVQSKPQSAPISPPPAPVKTKSWKDCKVGYFQGTLCVFRGERQVAYDSGVLAQALKDNKLKADKGILVDVEVVRNGDKWRIAEVLDLRTKA